MQYYGLGMKYVNVLIIAQNLKRKRGIAQMPEEAILCPDCAKYAPAKNVSTINYAGEGDLTLCETCHKARGTE